jgi:hypothetical protein
MGNYSIIIAQFTIVFDICGASGASAGDGVQVQVLLRALVLGTFSVTRFTRRKILPKSYRKM